MTEDINIEITEQVIELEIIGGATWDNIDNKPTPSHDNDFLIGNHLGIWEVKTVSEVNGILTGEASTDELVKYDSHDTAAGYLSDKIIAGTGITLSEGTGADENKLIINGANTYIKTGCFRIYCGKRLEQRNIGTRYFNYEVPLQCSC